MTESDEVVTVTDEDTSAVYQITYGARIMGASEEEEVEEEEEEAASTATTSLLAIAASMMVYLH